MGGLEAAMRTGYQRRARRGWGDPSISLTLDGSGDSATERRLAGIYGPESVWGRRRAAAAAEAEARRLAALATLPEQRHVSKLSEYRVLSDTQALELRVPCNVRQALQARHDTERVGDLMKRMAAERIISKAIKKFLDRKWLRRLSSVDRQLDRQLEHERLAKIPGGAGSVGTWTRDSLAANSAVSSGARRSDRERAVRGDAAGRPPVSQPRRRRPEATAANVSAALAAEFAGGDGGGAAAELTDHEREDLLAYVNPGVFGGAPRRRPGSAAARRQQQQRHARQEYVGSTGGGSSVGSGSRKARPASSPGPRHKHGGRFAGGGARAGAAARPASAYRDQ